MKFKFKILTIISFLFFCTHVNAAVKLPQKIDGMIELPVDKFSAIESDGQIYYVSNNGRYVITGQLYDLWGGNSLDTMAQIKTSTETIPLNGLNLKAKDLNTVILGSGDKEILLFVDPLSDVTKELIKQSRQIITDGNRDFAFKFIFIPALGDKSNIAAKKILCSSENVNDEEILNKVLSNQIGELKTSQCDISPYDRTLVMSTLLQIKRVPFLIANDGRFIEGIPNSYLNWLNNSNFK